MTASGFEHATLRLEGSRANQLSYPIYHVKDDEIYQCLGQYTEIPLTLDSKSPTLGLKLRSEKSFLQSHFTRYGEINHFLIWEKYFFTFRSQFEMNTGLMFSYTERFLRSAGWFGRLPVKTHTTTELWHLRWKENDFCPQNSGNILYKCVGIILLWVLGHKNRNSTSSDVFYSPIQSLPNVYWCLTEEVV